jgi:acetyl esterase/lipase
MKKLVEFAPNVKGFQQNLYKDEIKNPFINKSREIVTDDPKYYNEYNLYRIHWNITVPTISVHLAPKKKANGAAVVVFPGGGYRAVVIDREGYDVARYLNAKGISAIIVKYRVLPKSYKCRSAYLDPITVNSVYEDAREAMRVTHANAKEWNIDPKKIGILGFSAGGHLAHSLASDAVKDVPKPAFMTLLNPAIEENVYCPETYKNYPPTFLCITQNDKLVTVDCNVRLAQFLLKGKAPLDFHIYTYGGHGFHNKTKSGKEVTWHDDFETWLKAIGMIP